MSVIPLSAADLAAAAVLVLALALLSLRMRLEIGSRILVAAARTTIQLLLIGLVLRAIFETAGALWVMLLAGVMLIAAAREVAARQKRRLHGWWAFGIGAGAMFVSSFAVTVLALIVIIGNTPWYEPRYSIPLLGMLLGNTMNGIALATDRLTETAWQQRSGIEQRLLLGATWSEAIREIRRESARSGMIPIINAMAAAGLVSLPGMMTGQILAGSPPVDAVKYQILVMSLISAGTGFGVLVALQFTGRHLFDDRHRLRLDRLRAERRRA